MTTNLTINGAYNGTSGLVGVPSNLDASLNTLLQTYLVGASASIVGGTAAIENFNAVTNTVAFQATGSGGNSIEVFSNFSSTGASTGTANGSYTVTAGVTALAVQAPGNETLTGVGTTSVALFGANSNVDYTVNNGAGTVYAAGGTDSILATGSSSMMAVSAGNDTVEFNGTGGSDSVDATGSATTRVYVGGSDVVTVTASDSAQASVVFLQNAGGGLDFINNSSTAQTVYSGSYTVAGGAAVYAPNAVTVSGGAGGGFYVGGRGGFNSLTGGSGNVTLVGGGNSDVIASGSGTSNVLFAGVGATETLLGGTGSTNNSFFLGLEEVGIGLVTATSDIVSSNGSGAQNFIIGNVSAVTLTGSSVADSNTFDVLGSYTTTGGEATSISGGSFTIANFGSNDTILLINGSFGFGGTAPTVETVAASLSGTGSQILLSDGTVITLAGVSTSHVNVNGSEITYK